MRRALALTVLAGGITVLALGTLKGGPRPSADADETPVDRYQGHDVTLSIAVPTALGVASAPAVAA